MKSSTRKFAAVSIAAAVLTSLAAITTPLRAETPHDGSSRMQHGMPGHDRMPGMKHHPMMMNTTDGATPTMPGQDAFGAVQEIVRILEADPKTDWSKVNLEALRQHLIDMNEVTLKADAAAKAVEGGLEITVTGAGRTLAAIQRMVPAHAAEIDGTKGWSAKSAMLPNGVLLTVTAKDAREVQRLRALGFIGIMASGAHHQAHHLAMAKGEFAHKH